MGSPSPAAGKLKKESSSSSGSKVGVTTPHRRTSSSVASSCLSEELQDVQSPVRSVNGLGKSPVAATSPRTPASGTSPAALKKRRASIGGSDDLARGLDFSSPSTEEKKHSFLTKGGGHKKVATPAKVTTPPSKEKVVVARATGASVLSPRKLGDVKKDSPRKSVLASEGNESVNGEGTTPKKASPRVVAAAKSSPRPTVKPVASTKKSTNGESESPLEVSPVKSLRKSITSLPSLKLKPGLTSPRAQKAVKTRQDTPAQPGRVKRRIEKAVPAEEVEAVSVCSTNGNETEAHDVETKVDEEGSTLLPSLMEDGDVGDEDMNSLEQGGDPGFENDTDMPTSWLSEDLPCMFSSLSSLPEPDESSSSALGDPLELLDEPEELVSELSNTNDENSVAAEHPRAISKEIVASEWNSIEPEREQEDKLVATNEQAVMVVPSMVTEKASSSDNEASFQVTEEPSVEPTKVEVPKSEVECDTFTGENVPYVYISGGGSLQEEGNARPAEEEMLVSSSDDEDLIEGSCGAQLNLKQSFDEAAEADEKEHIVTEECSIVEQKVTESDAAKFTPTTHLDKDMMIFDFEEYWTHNVGDESSHYDAGHIDADELHPTEAKVPTPVEAKSITPIELPASILPEEESMMSQSPKSIPVEESDEDEVFHVYNNSAQSSPKELIHAEGSDSRYTTLDTEHCNGVENPSVPEDKIVEQVPILGQDSSVAALPSVAVDDQETVAEAGDLDTAPIFLAVTSNGLLDANIQDVHENGSEDPPISPVTVPLSSQAGFFEALDENSSSMPEVFAKTTDNRDDELLPENSIATPISEVAAEPGVSQDFISTSKLEGGDNALVSGEKVASDESDASMPPVIGINEEEQTEAHFLMSLDNTEESALITNLREEQSQGLVGGDQLISDSKENLSVNEAKVPEDEILSAEKPQELQSHDDEPVETSHEESSEVDHYPSTETLHDENDEVLTEKSLQSGILSDPVFDQEDEIIKDSKPDVEYKGIHVEPTVPLEEANVRSTMVVTDAEETTNHTDTAEILEEGEDIYSNTASPFIVPAGELSKLALNESGEFGNRSEGTADEEKRGGFEEQSIRAEQVLEEEEADSKSSTGIKKDLSSAESVVSEAALVADAKYDTREDVEIDMEESKEASRTISTPVSTPSNILECHDQKSHIPLGTPTDPVSKTEAALETEKVLQPSLDAAFDDVEIAPDQFSSEDLPLEPCVPSDLQTSRSTADSNETEVSDLTRFKEGENVSESLDTVMDIPQNLFIPSSLDIDVDESEENSALPCKSEETKQVTVPQEDDETCSPKTTSFLGTSQAENPETTLSNDVETHSNNGDHKEESLNEELSVDSFKDVVGFSSQNNGIRTTPWIDDSEEARKVEESSPKRSEVVSGEDTAQLNVNESEEHSSEDSKDMEKQLSIDVKEMEEHSSRQESLNGRLTRDEDEDQVVHSPKSPRHVEETPNTSASSTTHIQDNSWSDDKVEEDVKKESLLEDDDIVVYRPDLKESSPEAVIKVEESSPKIMEKMEELQQKDEEEIKEVATVSEDTVEYRPTLNESVKMVDSPMEVFNVSQNAAVVDDEDDDRLNGNFDTTVQHFIVAKDLPNANQLVAADELEKQTEKEVEALPRSQELEVEEPLLESSKELSVAPDAATKTSSLALANELEKDESSSHHQEEPSMFEVEEKVVENSKEPYVTPILLNANPSNSVVADDLEKTTETLEKSMLEVEESSEEASVAPELLSAKSVADESELKQTETWDEKSTDQMMVQSSKIPLVVSDKDNGVAMTSDGEDLDEHPTDKILNGIHHEEELTLKAQDTVVDSPSDNLNKDTVLNDAIPSSDGIAQPHDREVEVADTVHLIEVPTLPAAAEDSQAPDVEESSATESEKKNNATKLESMHANTNSQADPELDSEPHTPTEPQSPTATLYPLLKPPFSGSQQDRLWEEQAEAYNSGQGTPSRNASQAGASSPAVTVLTDSCEDQIQPVTNSNGNHAAAAAAAVSSNGAAASHENGNIPNQDLALKERNGKDKLHTPLRSLLLEDANHNHSITPNGVSSSPSFIRRLFRVMSTSSRSAERDASHAKLKKSSSSMWVSCLGSPQVQP